jgi:hypothetical protein
MKGGDRPEGRRDCGHAGLWGSGRAGRRSLLLLLVLGAGELCASGLGLTLGTSTFFPLGKADYPPIPAGMYYHAGLNWLPGRHLEIELYQVAQVTPRPYSEVLFGFSTGYWIIERKPTAFFNLVVDAGLLYGLDHSKLLTVNLSPLVQGSPEYCYSTRLCALGLLVDPERRRALLRLRLLTVTLYL